MTGGDEKLPVQNSWLKWLSQWNQQKKDKR